MATFTVTSLRDDGDGGVTLREAIIAANVLDGEDSIVFAEGLTGTISLMGGALEISDDVTIDAEGDITVDGGGASGVFVVTPEEGDVDVTLAAMTVSGGLAARGGGLFVGSGADATATVTLIDMTFNGNEATGDALGDGGGAVYLEDGEITIDSSIFQGNDATGDAGSGGHLFLDSGTMTVIETLLEDGSAVRAGGAIEIGAGGTLNVLSSVLALNLTGSAPGNGGAIHVTGASDVLIDSSAILGNFASAEGGGVWNNAGSTMEIVDSVIRNNIADGDAADNGGGGVFNNGGDLVITDSDVTLNTATGAAGSGGNILTTDGRVEISGSTIGQGDAARAGGGIEVIEGDVTITGSTFDRNATGDAPGNGGGLHVTGAAAVEIAGSTFRNNQATEGGAVWNSGTGTMELRANVFVGNVADGNDADQGGGAVFNNGGTLTSANDIYRLNSATGDAGSGGHLLTVAGEVEILNAIFLAGDASRAGGAIEVIAGTLDVEDSLFAGNATGSAPGNGGAIHVTADALTRVSGSSFLQNFASAEGGALWNSATGTMVLSDLRIEGNEAAGAGADQGGGGVYNDGGTLTLSDSMLSGNMASGDAGSGGHLLTVAGDVIVTGSTFEDGDANRAGGAIEIVEGQLDVIGSTFTGNDTGDAPGNGGAIHATGAADMLVEDSVFEDNSASNEGGALWNSATGMLTVLSSTFLDNVAGSGGAIFSNGGGLFIGTGDGDASLIAGNEADDAAVVATGDGPLEVAQVAFGDDQPVIGSDGDDSFEGSGSDESVNGGDGNDVLLGAGGDDALLGGAGSDILSGGTGVNALIGGAGTDFFAFFDAPDPGVSTILDFGDEDFIALDDQLFDRGSSGVNPRLVTEEIAALAIDLGLFQYDGSTGEITLDADGFAGDGDAQLVAVIDGGGSIDRTDFLVF